MYVYIYIYIYHKSHNNHKRDDDNKHNNHHNNDKVLLRCEEAQHAGEAAEPKHVLTVCNNNV